MNSCNSGIQQKQILSEIHSFLSIFFTSNSFFPQTLILLTHVLTFTMLSPHVLFPLSYFTFTIHTKSEPLRTPAKLIQRSIKDKSYLLARLFARYLLPPNTISQGFADRQPWHPLLHELVMRLYISRYQVQGDSWSWQSLTMGWRGDRWQNRNWCQTLQPWGDISRCRWRLIIEEVDGLRSSLPHSPTPIEFTIRCLTHQRPFARCRLPPLNL